MHSCSSLSQGQEEKCVQQCVLPEANSHGRQEGEETIISYFVAQINLLWSTLSFGLFDKISFKKLKKNPFSSELYRLMAELILFYKAVAL